MIQHFRIERCLGQGGFAITYLATDTKLGCEVAIKELYPDKYVTRQGRNVVPIGDRKTWNDIFEKFSDEARHLARFRHSNIVQVKNLIEANATAYIVMQYVEGQTFSQYLDDLGRRPKEAELVVILMQILDGLEAVHRNGLLHRDVKPGNIYITRQGTVVLLDFGTARPEKKPPNAKSLIFYSGGYTSYEQCIGTIKLTHAADIYSVAATFVKAITGKEPTESVRRKDRDDYEPLSVRHRTRYSAALLKGIDMGMALKAEHRPQSVAQWRSILFGKPSPPPPPNISHRATLIFTFFVCLVVAFTAAWIAIRMGTQKSTTTEAVGSESASKTSERIAVLSPPHVALIPPTLPSPPNQPPQANNEPTKVATVPTPVPNTKVTAATSTSTNDLDRDLNAFLKDELEQPMRPENYASQIVVNDSGEATDQKEMSRDELVAEETRDEAKYVAGVGQFTHLGSKRLSYDTGKDTAEMRQIFSYDRTSKSTGARRFGLVIRQVVIEKATAKERCISKRIVTARAIGYRCRLSLADHPAPATGSSQSRSNADMIRSILQRDRENVESRSLADPEDMSFPLFRTEAARQKIATVQDKQLILIPSGDESVQQIVSGTPVVDVFPDLEGPDPAIVIVVKP
jgi:serine/threonine protein kinase